jgi:hypothetical protein
MTATVKWLEKAQCPLALRPSLSDRQWMLLTGTKPTEESTTATAKTPASDTIDAPPRKIPRAKLISQVMTCFNGRPSSGRDVENRVKAKLYEFTTKHERKLDQKTWPLANKDASTFPSSRIRRFFKKNSATPRSWTTLSVSRFIPHVCPNAECHWTQKQFLLQSLRSNKYFSIPWSQECCSRKSPFLKKVSKISQSQKYLALVRV